MGSTDGVKGSIISGNNMHVVLATRSIFRQGDPASMSMLPHPGTGDRTFIRSRTGCMVVALGRVPSDATSNNA